MHLPRRSAHRPDMARLRLLVLSQGSGVRAQRPQTEGTEGAARQARIRGHLHDRGQGLGGGTYLWTDHHGPNSGMSSNA